MGLLALVVLAPPKLDDADLVALAMALDGRDHLGRGHIRCADGYRGAGAHQQHALEFHARALVGFELLDAHHGTFLYAVLHTSLTTP